MYVFNLEIELESKYKTRVSNELAFNFKELFGCACI
jgi:hypothetical protein